MLEKKLLALADIVGILMCGACLLPPLPEKKISLPPPLRSLCKMAVQVDDGTAGNFFDPVVMSKAVSVNFNRFWTDYRLRAETFSAGGKYDAVLRIAVLNKIASCVPSGNGEYCLIELIASYALTATDDRVLLDRPRLYSKNGIWQQGRPLPEDLKANTFRRLASESLASEVGKTMILSEDSN